MSCTVFYPIVPTMCRLPDLQVLSAYLNILYTISAMANDADDNLYA